jgi:hypothetical protein
MPSNPATSPIRDGRVFLEFVREPANGFLSVSLPLKGGTRLCLKIA